MVDYLTKSQDRINAILTDRPSRFHFESQTLENLPGNLPPQFFEQHRGFPIPFSDTKVLVNTQTNWLGSAAVERNSEAIEYYSGEYGINSNIVKAIVYTENARGSSYGVILDLVGASKTVLPGNIDKNLWKDLIPGTDFNDEGQNIRASTKLISEIAERLDDPSVENIYSLYNSLAHDRTYTNDEFKLTPYFAKRAFEDKAWNNPNWHLEGGYSNGRIFGSELQGIIHGGEGFDELRGGSIEQFSQLSTYGTDAPGSWSSLTFNVWSAPSFDSGVPGTSLSFGSLDGFGGLDAGHRGAVFQRAPSRRSCAGQRISAADLLDCRIDLS